MSIATDPTTDDRPVLAPPSRVRRGELLSHAHLLLPGALTAFLCFRAGGFFPGITGLATVAVATVLLLRVTLVADPFAGWTRAAAGAALAGACFASWTLASAVWSGATARAIVEFDRALLYILLLALLATVPRRSTSLSVLLRWVLVAFAVVALAGLASRLAPGIFPISGRFIAERLSFPLTYWNATGMAAALGTVLALHHASGEQEPRWVRVAATAALPGLVTALYFTFSRGAIAAGAIGVVAYAVLAHPRRLPFALAAALPPSVAAVVAAYGADALATERYFAGDGPGEGRALALMLAGLTLAAGGIRVALQGLEQRAQDMVLPRRAFLAAAGAAVLVVLALGVALDAPGRVDRELDAFRSGNVVPVTGDARDRLTQVGNNGRLDFWEASLSAFEAEPLRGGGAGTYRLAWQRERPNAMTVNDGHSLYLEVLAELGVVGLLLLTATLLVPVAVAATRLRGPERHAHAAFLAAAAVLLIHAGVDWDWEMPALWVWFFAAAGVVVAGPGGRAAAPARVTRVVVGLGCLLLAATPALVVVSQPALSDSRRAFVRGDCGTAVDRALASLENLRVWPEAYEILGYCNLRGGEVDLALRSMRAAHDRDPRDWQFAYGLAIAQAFAGEDPRPAAALAARLNPNEELATELSRRLRAADPERWPRVAARARIPQR
jgi:O-Antigen ligase